MKPGAEKVLFWTGAFVILAVIVALVAVPFFMGTSAQTKAILEKAERDRVAAVAATQAPKVEVKKEIDESQDMKVTLGPGSNPWRLTASILRSSGHYSGLKNPSKAQIRAATKLLCAQNSVGVPVWKLSGKLSDRAIAPDHELSVSFKDLIAAAQAVGGK